MDVARVLLIGGIRKYGMKFMKNIPNTKYSHLCHYEHCYENPIGGDPVCSEESSVWYYAVVAISSSCPHCVARNITVKCIMTK